MLPFVLMPRERLIEFNEDNRDNMDDICYNEIKIPFNKKIYIEYTELEDLQQLMIKQSNP